MNWYDEGVSVAGRRSGLESGASQPCTLLMMHRFGPLSHQILDQNICKAISCMAMSEFLHQLLGLLSYSSWPVSLPKKTRLDSSSAWIVPCLLVSTDVFRLQPPYGHSSSLLPQQWRQRTLNVSLIAHLNSCWDIISVFILSALKFQKV